MAHHPSSEQTRATAALEQAARQEAELARGIHRYGVGELVAALEPHGLTAVRGEEEREVALALYERYKSARQRAAGEAIQQLQYLSGKLSTSEAIITCAQLRGTVARLDELLGREEYHWQVSLGQVSYRARDDE